MYGNRHDNFGKIAIAQETNVAQELVFCAGWILVMVQVRGMAEIRQSSRF